jgi:hypothetical protein
MALLLRSAVLALSLSAAGAARASSWRAAPSEEGPGKRCVEVKETIDEFVASRARRMGTCKLNLDVAQLSRGYVVLCGPERGFILFRSQRTCLASLGAVKAQRLLTASEAAPEGTTSPERWLDTMGVCLRSVTPEVVSAGRVQAQVSWCECAASWAGGFRGEAEVPRLQGAWEEALGRCSEAILGARLPAETLSEEAAAMLGALAARPAPAAAGSNPGPPATGDASAVRAVRAGDAYAVVMSTLQAYPAEKQTSGDDLTATFRTPALLTYPDAGGACVLTFAKGRLEQCEGCDPLRFKCGR